MGFSQQARRGLTLVFLALLGGGAQAQVFGCAEDLVAVIGDFGRANFHVAVADEPAERGQGLMNVPSMPVLSGMLFVYPAPQHASFWMRNTLIPLDMLFADQTGTIRKIHPEAAPLDETSIDGGENVQFVLEINGGMAARLGIAAGDVMVHPAIGPDAALPCD